MASDHDKCEEEMRSDCEEEEKRDGSETTEETAVETEGNPGWADAMAKILGKRLTDEKPPVLIKYKKAEREKKQRIEEQSKQKLVAQEKRSTREQNHVKPKLLNDENERNLRRIATRGVVKLFNAVNKHQKDLESKFQTAPTEAKKAKVMKSVSKTSFLEMLKNNSSDVVDTLNDDAVGNTDKVSRWSVLRDDFMMGGKMKDWDKDDDDVEYENEENTPAVMTEEHSDSE